jgi:hypothetical protein
VPGAERIALDHQHTYLRRGQQDALSPRPTPICQILTNELAPSEEEGTQRPSSAPHLYGATGNGFASEFTSAPLLLGWASSMALVGYYLRRGWIPHDEGTIASTAERVLHGQIPHRDFVDVYTGGLTYLNALAFKIFGITLLAPRLMLAVFAGFWIVVVFRIASRFVLPWEATAITLLATAWSLPNYIAALPSWYILFSGSAAQLALLKHAEDARGRWLFAAGAACGLAVLAKISGVFLFAGALLYAVYHEQRSTANEEESSGGLTIYPLLLAFGGALVVAAVAILIRSARGPAAAIHFVLPSAFCVGVLLRNELPLQRVPVRRRLLRLSRAVGTLTVGASVPLIVFLVPFVASGSVQALGNGIFILPMKRLGSATQQLPWVIPSVLPISLLVLVVGFPSLWKGVGFSLRVAMCCLAALLVFSAGCEPQLYRATWHAVRFAGPTAVAAAAAWLIWIGERKERFPAQLYALTATTTLWTLIQFPFSAPVYFCYVAPAILLTATALLARTGRHTHSGARLGWLFLLCFALFRVNPGYVEKMGILYEPSGSVRPLRNPRGGGLLVQPSSGESYDLLAGELARRANGRPVYAGPDAPEIYFLAAVPAINGQLFDFFEEPAGYESRLLTALFSADSRAIAINRSPSFSRRLTPSMLAMLERRFPESADFGSFTLRWRE